MFKFQIYIILILILFNIYGCSSSDEKSSFETGSEPGPKNQILRLFQKPFDGQYNNGWPFDHNLPLGVFNKDIITSGNNNVLTWRGEEVVLTWGNGKYHNGHDWIMPEGTRLKAVADGEVIFADYETPFQCGNKGKVAALIVLIEHTVSDNQIFQSQYVHLSRIDVQAGEYVKSGQQIGLSGSTGCASGPHLHFSVYRLTDTNNNKKTIIDPFGWEGQGDDPWEMHPDGAKSLWLWKHKLAPEGDYSF